MPVAIFSTASNVFKFQGLLYREKLALQSEVILYNISFPVTACLSYSQMVYLRPTELPSMDT